MSGRGIVRSGTLKIITSILHDRALKGVLDDQSSTTYNIKVGMPQGSVLGPILFLVFINVLPDDVLSGIGI